MSRNITFQVLRGTLAKFSTLQGGIDPDTGAAASPLALGEMFFTTDTHALYFGTPGIGQGSILLGDTTAMNETLLQILNEMRCMRLALTQLACEGGKARPQDFDPQYVASDAEVADMQQV
jgi:hypothetical protein